MLDEAYEVAMAAAEALADLCDAGSAPLMAERLMQYKVTGPAPWSIGESMCRLLAEAEDSIRDPAVARLVGYLSDPDPHIRIPSCLILRNCAKRDYMRYNDAILEAAGADPATGEVRGCPNIDRVSLYTAVAASGDARAIPGLLRSIALCEGAGKERTAEALLHLGGSGLDALARVASDPAQPTDDRCAAISALEKGAASGDTRAATHLEELSEEVKVKGERRISLRVSLALKRLRLGLAGSRNA